MGENLKLPPCRGRVHRQVKVYCTAFQVCNELVPLIYIPAQSRCTRMRSCIVFVLGSDMRVGFKLLAISVLEIKLVLELNPMQSKSM